MTPEQRKTVIFIEDDTLIKSLLVEHCRTMPQQGSSNICAICIRDEKRGKFWYVVRTFVPGDEGYVALGIDLNSTREFQKEISDTLLQGISNKRVTQQSAPITN